MARLRIRMTLLAALMGACVAGSEDAEPLDPGVDEVRLGIVNHYGESADVLELPSAVTVGAPVDVIVRTYGGGCEQPHSIEVRPEQDGFRLTPYDRTFRPPQTDPDVVEACVDALFRFEHVATLQFDEVGTKLIVVQGRHVNHVTDRELELAFELRVEE